MPEKPLADVLAHLQQVIDDLDDRGRTTLTPAQIETLRRQVAWIQMDEDRRIDYLHKEPRIVKWDDDYFEDIGDREGTPA